MAMVCNRHIPTLRNDLLDTTFSAVREEWQRDTETSPIAAHYEYNPYGNVIGPDDDGPSDPGYGDWRDDAGPYALANPIRFSTKWFDAETHLGYWGHRYYSPRLGRWISRDPMGDLIVRRLGRLGTIFMEGAAAVMRSRKAHAILRSMSSELSLSYHFVLNRPCDGIDALGLEEVVGTLYDCPNAPPSPGCDGCCDSPSFASLLSVPLGSDHTVMCDGKGGCQALLRDVNWWTEDVRHCVIEHECTHCEQLKRQGDPCCTCGVPSIPLGGTPQSLDIDECEAYIVSAKCLQKTLNACRGWCYEQICAFCHHMCMVEYHCHPLGGYTGGAGSRRVLEMCLDNCRTNYGCP